MKYLLFLFPIFLQAQCLIPTHSYRLICADEVRYADSISSGTRLYISSRNAFVTSPRSVFSLVNGYGQHFIQITNSANSQKVAINRAWINRIDSTSSNKALIYIKDISVTFTTVESYTAVKDSAIACFVRAVASGLATLSDGDYGDVVVSGGGLVMTVDKPDLGIHNLADGDFSVVADSTALSLTNTRAITLQTKNIDGWISRYLQTNNTLTLRTNNTTKTSRIFVDTTGANFQFVNGSNNASLRVGDSVSVRFNTSGSVGDVLTVTSIDGDGRLVINPSEGGVGTANCEQTLTKNSHGFSKWTPIYWNGSAWARPTFDSIIPTYIVIDSTSANTFKVSNCGNYSSTLTSGLYYYKGASPGYSLTPTSIPTPLFEVAEARLILQPLVGFNLAGEGGSGDVTSGVLADTAAAIRADFPSGGVTDGDKGDITVSSSGVTWTVDNGVVTSAKIASQTVDSLDIKNGSITTVKVEDNAITTAKVASQTLDSTDLKNRGTTLLKLAQSGATNGQVPVYNSTSGNWEASTISGGTGNGIKHVFSNSQPSDTTVAWVDTRYDIQKSYCIRTYLNGAWTDTTDNARYYDYIGKTISNGKPIAILFSGQSNSGTSLYLPATPSNYYGDTVTRKNIAYYDGTSWKVYVFATRTDLFSSSVGVNQVVHLAQLLSKDTRRAIRLVGTRAPSIPLKDWEAGGTEWTSLMNRANASGIKQFEIFTWIHGEAGLGSGSAFATYRQSFYDFISRLRTQTWMAQGKTKIIATTHALAIGNVAPNPSSPEGTQIGLDGDNDSYTGWAAIPYTKEALAGGGTDVYHFTTSDHERIGQSIYNTYKRLPYLGGNQDNRVYYSTFSAAGIPSWQIKGFINSDSISTRRGSYSGSNTGFFSEDYAFSANNNYTSRQVAAPEGGSNRGRFEIWHNSAGSTATSSDVMSRSSYLGNAFWQRAGTGILAIHTSSTIPGIAVSSSANNTGDAILSFHNDGSVAPPTALGKFLIVARATGSFSQSDLHFVASPAGGATPVVGTNTVAILKQDGKLGLNTITPNSRLHFNGSFASSMTATLTASAELDVTQHHVLVSGASSTVVITLAQNNSGAAIAGREYRVTCTNLTNPVSVVPKTAASDLIYLPSGTTTTSLPFTRLYQTFVFKSIGTNQWLLIDDYDLRYKGTGTPEGVVTAPVGSFFQRTDGSAGTTFYIKESGTGNTGWIPSVSQLKGSGTLDFPDTASGTSSSLTITVTGAATTDSGVSVQRDNASISGTSYEWVITGANTVTVYFHNFSGSNQNPASGTFRATVTK